MGSKHHFDLAKCARPNILVLRPYISPRFDFPDETAITLLDANENAFGPSITTKDNPSDTSDTDTIQSVLDPTVLRLNRYPDAQQTNLKQLLCTLRNTSQSNTLTHQNICLGVGSDESIDGIIRAFCVPGKYKILVCPPTYIMIMYQVSAGVNDIGVVFVNLDNQNGFALKPDDSTLALSRDPSIKVVFICSPGNPAGNLLAKSDIIQILEYSGWNGVVVVDGAYIDIAPAGSSLTSS